MSDDADEVPSREREYVQPPENEKDIEIYDDRLVVHIGPWNSAEMTWESIAEVTLFKIHGMGLNVTYLRFVADHTSVEFSSSKTGYRELVAELENHLKITNPQWPKLIRRHPPGPKVVIYNREAAANNETTGSGF